eukprot:g7449.t1
MARTDRDALLAFYKATDGTRWLRNDGWDTDAALSDWHGVDVDDQGRVVVLSLATNNLRGPIPAELGALRELRELWLDNNELTGHIPAQLGDLNKLTQLDLSDNQLSGPIPKELGALSKLEQLGLQKNGLTGNIPPHLGELRTLVFLNLSGNKLEGRIPEELGKLTALREIILCDNQLSGHIPRQLGDLSALQYLLLSENKLDGAIPAQLGALNKLVWFDLSDNQLSGVIPPELGDLRELRFLWLNNNQLTAMWDHSSDIGSENTSHQANAAGVSIPKQLGELLALLLKVNLKMGGNPWKEPPEAVVEKGMPAVWEYFADLFAEGVAHVPRTMIKVVLVGQEGAGKTSLRQSIRNRRPTPTGGPAESTVQIDVEEVKMDVDGVSLRVYDCAGQVAYTGLLQMFLSPRAVSLLVCNAEAFGQGDDCTSDKVQLTQDLSKLRELRVCDWLRSLSFRIPDSDVVVVATKCDLVAAGTAASLAGKMERAIRRWLEYWRGSDMTAVRVEDGVSLTSCAASSASGKERDDVLGKRKKPDESLWACDWREDICDDFPPTLLHRIMYNGEGALRGAAMVLPRSWNIALEVLEALGSGREAIETVRQMDLAVDGREGMEGLASTFGKQHKGIEGVTRADLSAKWRDVVKTLEGDGMKVTNPDHALEGALCIREHEGSIVRHETYVFLDVAWLAKILKPLLNHRDDEDFSGSLCLGDTGITLDDDEHIAAWKRFKSNGVLELALAKVLWPDGLSEYVLPALDSLGLAHPLDGDSTEGLVVLLRLGEERPKDVGKELDDFRRDHRAVLSVTWKIFLGVPPGAIEKVLTRCCSIGALRTFWRFGVLIQGGLGRVSAGKTFALLVEYSPDKNEIDMQVYGDISNAAPWKALSFGVSVVRKMCLEFPGLRWRAHVNCPQHDQDMPINKAAIRPGDKLLHGGSCSLCSPETGGLGAAAADLLELVDVLQSKDEIFRSVSKRFVRLQLMEEVEGFLSRSRNAPGQKDVEEDTKVAKREDASGMSDQVATLQRLIEDLQRQHRLQHQDMRGWHEVVDKRLEALVDADAGAKETRDFLKSMLMAVMCSTLAAMAVAPVSGAGAVVEATVSTAKESFESMMQDQLAALAIDDDDGAAVNMEPKANVKPQPAQLGGGAYSSLREFIHNVEDTVRLEMAKAERGRHAPKSPSEFVFFSQVMTKANPHYA